MKQQHYPIIVIGAGAGGLVVAIGAAKAKKRVLLIEKGHYGGDCTNFGCIPSKCMIAAGHAAYAAQSLNTFGLKGNVTDFNGDDALARTREIIQKILTHEDPEALGKMGVETLTETASFVDSNTLLVGNKKVTGDQIVIATGSTPFIPSIPGLDTVPYHTNETIFSLEKIPSSLAIIGGGPIGCELAQAFSRLGAKVSIIEMMPQLLGKEDNEAAQVVFEQLQKEGVTIYLNHQTVEVMRQGEMTLMRVKDKEEKSFELETSHLLLSVGRRANFTSLQLHAAGIAHTKKGITVDPYGRTSQKHIWAVGDVVGRAPFTHVAENEARTVLTNLLVPWPLKFKIDSVQPIPRVTFTDPEVASVGLSQREAVALYGEKWVATYQVPFSDLDRALTTSRTEGFVKIVTKKWSSKILGATIVAPSAGEMLMEVSTAIAGGISLRRLTKVIHPYPTYSLAIRKASDKWLTETILPLFRIGYKK